mmetsp:Transcript_22167/g.71635  ORF Transcript_22167/g.71635 Transcript_22167/m.71635 type:complete len:288 (-) Transcript_22167:126-989(-)
MRPFPRRRRDRQTDCAQKIEHSGCDEQHVGCRGVPSKPRLHQWGGDRLLDCEATEVDGEETDAGPHADRWRGYGLGGRTGRIGVGRSGACAPFTISSWLQLAEVARLAQHDHIERGHRPTLHAVRVDAEHSDGEGRHLRHKRAACGPKDEAKDRHSGKPSRQLRSPAGRRRDGDVRLLYCLCTPRADALQQTGDEHCPRSRIGAGKALGSISPQHEDRASKSIRARCTQGEGKAQEECTFGADAVRDCADGDGADPLADRVDGYHPSVEILVRAERFKVMPERWHDK